ncbi:hypothetical protein FRC12_008238 [Ceratobasidium sp. 428]|nr:hypothetical protein FRC12_008238 [Ceratobasidium sp. 428]
MTTRKKVENTLFKVHRYQLMKSEVFSDMFQTAKGDTNEGSSPESPIMLEGISASDFESLLDVLYASKFSSTQVTPGPEVIIPALRLSHKWNFEDLYNHLVVFAQDKIDNIDKIVLARECGIKQWLEPAHTGLCLRKEPFTTDEAAKIGIDSLLLIIRIRDESHTSALGPEQQAPICCNCTGHLVHHCNTYCGMCNTYSHFITPPRQFPGLSEAEIKSRVEEWIAREYVFSS